MSLSVTPALWEIVKLGGVVLLMLALGFAYLWLNYKVWSYKLYLPCKILLGISLGVFLVGMQASWLTVAFAALVPIAIGFYFRFQLRGGYRTPAFFLAPAALGILLLFLYPLLYEFYLSFHDLSLRTFSEWVNNGRAPLAGKFGLDNYFEVFRDRATGQAFFVVFMRTLLWTAINLVFHVGIGLILALLLNTAGLKGKGFYRTLLTLPWVMPQVIAVLVWRADFNESVGFINKFIVVMNRLFSFEWSGTVIEPLTWIGFRPQAWFLDPGALFAAACIVNIWLGVPFMMINALGALQSIPKSVYEAAAIDGARAWQRFLHVTLPLLKPVMVPATMLGAIWTFNNLNVIVLMTDMGRYEGADILVSDLYKQSFTYYRYGFAAAYSFVIFAILCVFTYAQSRLNRQADPDKKKKSSTTQDRNQNSSVPAQKLGSSGVY